VTGDAGTLDSGQRRCARGDWCLLRTVTTTAGEPQIIPAPTWRSFCESDRDDISRCLDDLPAGYVRLAHELGEKSRGGQVVRVPFGPRLPLSGHVDALMRLLAETLLSWEERLRDVARLAVLDTQLSRHRNQARAVRDAAKVLGAHLDAVLALQPGPMTRDDYGEIVIADLDGGDAGLEILRLHYRCRAVLGEVRARPESLDGVPCKQCGDIALERAEPPSDPAAEAMHSRCASCGAGMTLKDYASWVRWYARWADGAGLTCRRCELNRHDECEHDGCGCIICGNAVTVA
jgi:hypothetical protein